MIDSGYSLKSAFKYRSPLLLIHYFGSVTNSSAGGQILPALALSSRVKHIKFIDHFIEVFITEFILMK